MDRSSCSQCNGAGWYLESVPVGHPQFGKLLPCVCMQAAQLARREADEIESRKRRLIGLASELGHMAQISLQSFSLDRPISGPVTWHKKTYAVLDQRKLLHLAWHTVANYAKAPSGWLFLMGGVGSGKTLLAAGCANAVTERQTVTYASAPKLLRHIRAGFEDRSADARLEAVQTTPILVIDDIGAEQLTDWSESLLFDLLNQRYHYDRCTILTSNLHHDQLPPRIASRIVERCDRSGVITLAIDDYRRLPIRDNAKQPGMSA